jgi:hypothetical protein
MSHIDLIKATAIHATNDLMRENGLPPVLTDVVNPAYNDDAIKAFKQHEGLPSSLVAIMDEKWAKAALVDEMAAALKGIDASFCLGFDTADDRHVGRKALIACRAAVAKYEALPK